MPGGPQDTRHGSFKSGAGSSYKGARGAWSCRRELGQGHGAGPPRRHPASLPGQLEAGPVPCPLTAVQAHFTDVLGPEARS